MASVVLAEGDISVDQWCPDRREGIGSQSPFTEKIVDWAGSGGGHKHSLSIGPAVSIGRTTTDEDGTRSAESDEFMRVYRKIVSGKWACVFEKISGHPVIFAGGSYVFETLTPVAAVELRSACS